MSGYDKNASHYIVITAMAYPFFNIYAYYNKYNTFVFALVNV